MDETRLEQARRHVVEGRARIREQEARIDKLAVDGHLGKLAQSQALLAAMQETQRLAEDYLEMEEREASLHPRAD